MKYTEDYNNTKNKIELIGKCPYCEKDTHLKHVHEPVHSESKYLFECEKCNKSFYGIINIQSIKCSY
jgi:hypothetical protein